MADFSASVVSGCGPLGVAFKDLSTNKPYSWTWDFGNGQISNQQNPSVSYSTPGTYTVTLIAKNASGAASVRKTDYITVYPFPTAAFSSDLQVGCSPASIQFTDQSTPGQGTITSWTWDFSDGTTSSQQNPSHVFTQTGYYDVGLTVVNSGGCRYRGAKGKYIRVVPGVQTAFSWSQTSPSCSAPFDISFINQTSGPGTLSYNWDLGNSTTSAQTNPLATYPTNNPYTITLIAKSTLGCADTTTKSISFQGNAPVITAPDQACVNNPVNFQNGSSPAPVSSAWAFGDGSTADVANPGKTYTATGSYTVTLTNTYSACSASASKTIQIVDAPAITFIASQTASCTAPLTTTFTDHTTGTITSRLWDFGDGTTSTDPSPQHTYTSTGSFDVTLTVTGATGCNGTLTKKQFINIAAPTIALANPGSLHGCVGEAIKPQAAINAVDGVATYAWTATGATPGTSNLANPSFTYAAQGNYTLSLVVTTQGGCSASATFNNAVEVGTPSVSVINATTSPTCGRTPIQFSATSTPAADQWAWNFGDGSPVEFPSVLSHTYNDIGDFTVTLVVDHAGCHTTTNTTVHVNPPFAGFKYGAGDCTNKYTLTFTDTSKVDPALGTPTYSWNFGDGSPASTQQSPTHTYPDPGTAIVSYDVSLLVTNGGCSDLIKVPILIGSAVASYFESPDTTVCKNAVFTLRSSSSNPKLITSYAWKVDANPPVVSASPNYAFGIPTLGDHNISLTITDRAGCTSVAPGVVHVIGPIAAFTSAAGGCRNNPILFTDNSTPYSAAYPIVSWTIDGADSTTPTTFTAPPLTHSYADTGVYIPELTVSDSKGCTDRIRSLTAVKITAPHAGFFAVDTLYCPNALLPFTDSSQGNNLTYSWDFGDGSAAVPAGTPGISYTYATDAQYYSVKLKITDGTGCADSVTRTNYIHIQSPIAAFTLQDSAGICLPMQTTFIPMGQYYDSLYWNFGDGTQSTLDTTTHFYNNYGTFTVTLNLKGAGGCTSAASRKVYIYNPIATGSFSFTPTSGCDSFPVNFTVTPPPYTKFTLSFGDGAADSSNNKTPVHKYLFPSTYSPQLAMQDSSGCVIVVKSITGNVTVYGAVPFFNMTADKLCDAGTIFFSDVTITNDMPVSMAWDFGDGSPVVPGTVGDVNTENPPHTYASPGIFYPTLNLNTAHGCIESYSDTVHVYQTPHPLITLPNPSCVNTPLQFQGGLVTPDPIDTVNWSWNFGDGQTSTVQNPIVSYSQANTYTVALRTSVSFGCSDTTSQVLTINPPPSIKGPEVITTPVGTPVTIPFTYSPNSTTWIWSPNVNLSCDNCANPAASPIFNTLYYVTVTDINSCTATDSILVKTICNGDNYFLPNTFSPNNDGVNDVFYPRGTNLYNIQSMRIFNRWGQVVFERKNFPANSASDGWDGSFNSRPAPTDAYIYIVEVICNNGQVVTLKGDITLIR